MSATPATIAAFDTAKLHLRLAITAHRRDEQGAAAMYARTAAAFAARARRLGAAT